MNFDFSDEQKQIQEQVRRFLDKECPHSAVRKVLEGGEPCDRELYQGLAELGVLGATIPEEYGGTGMSHLEACLFAEELGRALAPVPVDSSIYLVAEFLLLAGNEDQKQKWLPRLASGKSIGAFAFLEGTGRMLPEKIETTARNGRISGTKAPVLDGPTADVAVVAARSEAGVSLYLVELDEEGVSRKPIASIDPTRPVASLEFDDVPGDLLGDAGAGWDIATRVIDRAAVQMAFEQLGGAEKALEESRDYALERMAFGRQIGSFQAIKHMLADNYVATALARANCYYAAWALASNAPELEVAAASARISATNAFQLSAKNNIQVHGGMGYTWESDCHFFYRRANALALTLGSLSTWENLLLERMCAEEPAAAA